MLDSAMSGQLKELLTRITQPIELVSRLDDSARSAEVAELLDEIAALSESVTHERGGSDGGSQYGSRTPSFVIRRAGGSPAVEFAGMPMGHEFTSLVLALLQVGGVPPKVADDSADQVKALDGEYHFEVFFSQSCQNCPDVIQAINAMAVLNPGVSITSIDGSFFPQEAEERGVLAVPTVFLNGEQFGQGRMTFDDILSKMDSGASARQAEKLSAQEPFDVLVIGGGPAGGTSAIYLARKGLRTGVVAGRMGGQMLDTNAIENYPSVAHTEGPKMSAELTEQVRSYDVEVMEGQEVSKLVPADEIGGWITLELASGATLKARSVILSTGARWRTLGVPGEDDYRNKGVTFCPHCDGPLFKGKNVAVIGGGNSGVEAAIDLAGVVGHVTVVEFLDEMRADDVLQRKLHSLDNVDVKLGRKTTEVSGDGSKVVGLVHEPRDGGDAESTDVEGVFVQIGLLPNTEFVKGTVLLNDHGEVQVDERGLTNVPGVFAAGDCTTVPYKQISVAVGQGATAALSAFDYLIRNNAPVDPTRGEAVHNDAPVPA